MCVRVELGCRRSPVLSENVEKSGGCLKTEHSQKAARPGPGRRHQSGCKTSIKEDCEQPAGSCQADTVEQGLWTEGWED